MSKIIRFIKKLFNKNKKVNFKAKGDLKNTIFIDLGASSIKACVNGKCKTFRSSIRKVVDANEITIQENAIEVNGEWFIIGENDIPTSAEILKFKKPFWEVFILYAIKLFENENNFENNIEINLLLPFSQLNTKNEFWKKMRNTKYILRDTNNKMRIYNLTLRNVYSEGEMSMYYIKKITSYFGNTVVCNIGHSTVDAVGFNKLGNRSKPVPIPYGMRNLMVDHNNILSVGLSSTLGAWKGDGYKYPKKYEKAIREANRSYVDNIMNELKLSMFGNYAPNCTRLVICGGGALEIGEDIKLWIAKEELLKEYDIEILENDNALYTDVLGMYVYVCENENEKFNFENIHDNEIENDVAIDKIENENFENKEIENENKIENIPISKKESKSQKTKNLIQIEKEKGNENKKSVAEILGISYQTVCRYWE